MIYYVCLQLACATFIVSAAAILLWQENSQSRRRLKEITEAPPLHSSEPSRRMREENQRLKLRLHCVRGKLENLLLIAGGDSQEGGGE